MFFFHKLQYYKSLSYNLSKKNSTKLLKVLSSEMDVAEIRNILYVVIKGWIAEIFREIRQYPILWGRDYKKNTPDFKTDFMEIF